MFGVPAKGTVGVGSGGASRASGKTKQNLFPSLIEKFLEGRARKIREKGFVLLAEGERRRGAGLARSARQLVGIFVKKSSDFNQKAPPDKK